MSTLTSVVEKVSSGPQLTDLILVVATVMLAVVAIFTLIVAWIQLARLVKSYRCNIITYWLNRIQEVKSKDSDASIDKERLKYIVSNLMYKWFPNEMKDFEEELKKSIQPTK